MLFYFCVILIIEQKIMVCDWGCAMNQKERYFQILLLILAAGSIYTLPYIRTNFQSVLLVAFDMSLEELSILYTLIGFLFIIGYIPSGWLADKFSIKYLIVISLVITACCGFYMATIPVKEHLYVIFLIWGISCVFTFWASLIKGITILSTSEEKPFVFGFLDGGRGLVEALLATMVFFIFKSVVNDSTSVDVLARGLSYVLSFYSLFILIIAVLILRFMNNLEEKGKVVDCGIDDVVGVFKRVDILLLCFIIFGGYTLFWTSYYMGGFIEIKLSIPTTGIVGIVTLMLWMRPLAGFTCGLVAAKLGTSKTLGIFTLLGALMLVFIVITEPASIKKITVMIMIYGYLIYSIRALYWSLIDRVHIERKVLGITIGIISFIGYLPDVLVPIGTNLLFTYTSSTLNAYVIYFIISVFIGLQAIVFIRLFSLKTSK